MKTRAGLSIATYFLCTAAFALATAFAGSAAAQEGNAQQGGVPFQSGAVQPGTDQTNPPPAAAQSQQNQGGRRGRGGRGGGPATLGLDQGFIDLDTPDFRVRLVKASQTLAALQPKSAEGFDFTPADQLQSRAADKYVHFGDLTMRLRQGSGDWKSFATAASRKPVTALPAGGNVLAAADFSPTLPDDCPLQVIRTWAVVNSRLTLNFELKNTSDAPVEIGSLGIPLVFNNYITGRSLEEAHAVCSFSDPAISLDGGYVQVTRLSGQGPALVVVPEGKTPFEAYNPILNDRDLPSEATRVFTDPTPRSQTFEGFYEWLVHSRAYAENEWKDVEPWNVATSETLQPGATRKIGLRFLLSPGIREIEQTLIADKRPVAVGIPGYILPMDLDGRLFLNYPAGVKSMHVEPRDALSIDKADSRSKEWKGYAVRGRKWGRARLTVTYDDGVVQTIHYYVIKPAAEAVADLGNFLFTKQWYVDPADPFKRSPSVMSYDRAKNQIVTQEARAWIAGLQDEGGAGSWLAAAMKLSGQPKKEEVKKLEQFIDGVLWGGIQYSEGPRKYGVRKSLFYYDTNAFPNYYSKEIRYGGWTSWNQREAESTGRAYNYPHVVAAYWTMYHLARNTRGLVENHPWEWYLEQAYQTTKYLTGRGPNGRYNVGYVNTGLMEGDIFVMLLKDMKREGWTEKAAEIEAAMKERVDLWNRQAYPFGSEMAWDSTGQEEVFAWTTYFGYKEKSEVSLNSILGYMPTVPHWGYNGNARRYWDFIYGAAPGPTSRIERQIHHYGSGINSVPVLTTYRERPDDFYLLRVGYGGMMGALSNIDKEGFASAAFHAWPNTLRWDHYSGDYGPGFFGHAINTATYVVDHPDFGWQAFGGNARVRGRTVRVQPLDSFRKRVYIAPRGLWLTLDAGTFESVEVDTRTHTVRVELSAQTPFTPEARLRVEQPAKLPGVGAYRPTENLVSERDAFTVPLGRRTTWVELSAGG